MKRTLLRLTVLVILSYFFQSCKKSEVFGGVEPNTDRVIAEFTDAENGSLVTLDFAPDVVEVDLTELRLGTRSKTEEPVHVKVTLNPALVTKYNEDNGTTYVAAGAAGFSLTQDLYTLKQNERSVMVRASVRPSALLGKSYAIGLSIAEMDKGEISSVAKNVVVFISIKNKYDGIYSLKGYAEIPGTAFTGAFSLNCAQELAVTTSGNSSVYLEPAQPVFNAGSFTYITNLLPDFMFDNNNKVTAVNGRTGSLGVIFPYDASYNSRYDPATKTIYVKYGIAPAGSGRYVIDTLTYCKPR